VKSNGLQELDRQYNRANARPGCMMKIDLSKAYDSDIPLTGLSIVKC